jgi:hypothetical protein
VLCFSPSQSSLRGASCARTSCFASLDLHRARVGGSLRSHPSLRSSGSLFGLYLVFIWSLLGLYWVSIGSLFGLYWICIWSIIRVCSRGLFGLYWVSIGSLLGLYWVSIGPLQSSLRGLASLAPLASLLWIFIWSLFGLYLVSIWSLFGLY